MKKNTTVTATVTALIALVALTGCSGGKSGVALGEPHEVKFSSNETKATVEMTVTSIDPVAVSSVPEVEIDGFEDGTLQLVQFDASLLSGNYEAGNSVLLTMQGKWSAKGVDDAEVLAVDFGYFNVPEIPGCTLFDSDLADDLSAGKPVSACVVFVAQEGVDVETVTFNPRLISRRGGGDKNWLVQGE